MQGRAPTRFHTLVLPAIIAQSMIIGGGYATGREVVEYAGRFGNWGWLSVAIITVCFAVVMALSFELARLAGAYDYKTWSRNLVGRFWWLVDILILSMMMLVIAVMTAAIGEVLQQTLALPKPVSPGVRPGVRRVSVLARFRLHREGEDLGQRRSLPGLLRLRGSGVDRSSRGGGYGAGRCGCGGRA